MADDEKIVPEKIIASLALQITVSDLSPNIQVKYFDIFSRLHGKEVYNGTGIRLAIEKKTDNHNGIIKVAGESDKGQGIDKA